MFGTNLKKSIERSEQLLASLKRRYQLLAEVNLANQHEIEELNCLQREQKVFGHADAASTSHEVVNGEDHSGILGFLNFYSKLLFY